MAIVVHSVGARSVSPPQSEQSQGGLRRACLVALLLAVLSLADIARWPLHDPDEFNYITASREMVESGDWVTPHFNGAPRLVKPVLFYWVIAGAYKVFGVHVVVARLCSAGAAAVGVLAVWLTARQLMGSSAALLAALIVSGNVAVLQFARAAMPDPTLWAFVALANYAFIRLNFPPVGPGATANPSQSAWFSHLFFAATALALLTKGPVALAWCLLPAACAAIRREWQGLRQLRWAGGLAIFFALAAPWAILFISRNAPDLRAQLVDPHSTQSYAYFSRPVRTLAQFLEAVPQLATNFLIWLPAIAAVLLSALGDRVFGASSTRPPERFRWRGFFLLWTVLLILIYALFYKKSIRYMFPIAGPASILLADALHRLLHEPRRRKDNAILLAACGAIALLLAGFLIAIMVRTTGTEARGLWPHTVIQIVAGSVLLGGCLRRQAQQAFPAVLAGCAFMHVGLLPQTLKVFSDRGPQELAPLLTQALRPDEPLLCYRVSPRILIFEARRTQIDVQSFPAFLDRLQAAPACFIRQEDWRQVPEAQRRGFQVIGQCTTFRSPPIFSADLSRNRQVALLLVRRAEWSHGPLTAPESP